MVAMRLVELSHLLRLAQGIHFNVKQTHTTQTRYMRNACTIAAVTPDVQMYNGMGQY